MRIKRILLSFIAVLLVLSTSLPVQAVDTILGVPISKFDNINSAKSRLSESMDDMSNYQSEHFKLKYQFDAYGFAYYVLDVVELLGVGSVSTLEEHMKFYNLSIKDPMTDKDEIEFSGTGDDIVVATSSQDFLTKMNKLAGSESDVTKDNDTLTSKLANLRKDAGFEVKPYNKNNLTWKESKLNEAELEVFIRENISDIRVLLTLTKDFIDNYYALIDQDLFAFLSNYFAETYDFFVQFSKEVDIEGLKDIDLFGNDAKSTFDPNRSEGHEDIGVWNIKDDKRNLEQMSEHMLKGIAASSTFRPFETNMNSTEAFSFLGQQMQLYHEAYGTKRKLIMTTTDGYNNLNTGLDLNATKNIKLMTLKDFIDKPNDTKILYLDNIDYDVSQIDDAQKAMKEGETTTDDAEKESIEGVTESTVKDDNRGFWANVNHGLNSTASYMNSNKYLDWLVLDSAPVGGMEGTIESVLFATGDVTKVSKVKKSLKKDIETVNMATLVYQNIMAEYKSNSKMKLKADMNKPLTVDIYGNILSASGIVIIPAVSNPFIWGNTKPAFLFNRAFIESYPEYIIENGVISATKNAKGKKAIILEPMNEEELEEQEKRTKENIDVTGSLDEAPELESEGGLKFTETLGEDIVPVLGGVQGYITDIGKATDKNEKSKLPDFKPTVDKFDNEYEPVKSLDLFTFPIAKDFKLDDYTKVRENFTLLQATERVATINNYTVKLTYSEEGTSEVVTFKDVPESDELKRFLYLSNLQEIINVKNGEIEDKVRLSPLAYKLVEEIYKNGVYSLNELNSLIPDGIESTYNKYINFLLEKANNRYDSVLGVDSSNNLLYNATLEENKAMKSFLPYMYKFILMIAIASIIISIALSVFSSEGKLKHVIRTLTVVYLITFLIQISPWVYEKAINDPLRWMMSKDTITWTVIQQEDNLQRVKQVTKDELVEKPLDEGSEIKLYKLNYTYPFKMLKTPDDAGMLNVDEYYEAFLNNDKAFANQNNRMWVDGRYVITDTNSLFESSRVLVDKPESDVLMKLTHEVYKQPELGYYIPYYMFIDNIVHNLNLSAELTKKIPNEIFYESGDIRTNGRMKDYLSSALFLDYDEFKKRIEDYKGSDRISEELSEAALGAIVDDYGEHEDHLGIAKILNMTEDINLAPFDEDQVERAYNTAWYPKFDYITTKDGKYDFKKLTYEDKMALQEASDKVNKKTQNFMLSLHPFVDKVSDETLIKTIALYASFEFNKAFSKWQSNDYMPTALELRDVSAERLLMAMSLKSEDLLNTEFDSYPLKVLEELGYFGLLISTYNDIVIVLINYVKPFMAILIWALSAVAIFTRKIIIPDPRNSSILGSLKSLALFTLMSVIYGISIWVVIKLTNVGAHPWISHGLTTLFSTAYLISLVFMAFFVVRDFKNVGSTYFFKGTEKMARFYGNAMKGMLGNTVLARSSKFKRALNSHGDNFERLGGNLENKAMRSMDTSDDIDFRKPLDFSTRSISKAADATVRTSKTLAMTGINAANDMKRRTRDTAATAATALTGIPLPKSGESNTPPPTETAGTQPVTPPKVSKDGKVNNKIDISLKPTPPKVNAVNAEELAERVTPRTKTLGSVGSDNSRYDGAVTKTNYFKRNK